MDYISDNDDEELTQIDIIGIMTTVEQALDYVISRLMLNLILAGEISCAEA